MTVYAGLDAGSVSVKLAVVDASGTLLRSEYIRHGGHPVSVAVTLLHSLLAQHPGALLACTGSAGKRLAEALALPHVGELSAMAAAAARLLPKVRTIFEMGGEDAKLLLLENGAIADFALNSVCAAGTGSFLDQQAERMHLSIEEFAERSLLSEHPPRIAGRCSVFAKSDMIHLQQIGTPVRDIVAGLCFAVARNFRGAIVRGRTLALPVAFLGGVSLNAGVVRAFREVFGMDEEALLVPANSTLYGALGAVLRARAEAGAELRPLDPERLRQLAESASPAHHAQGLPAQQTGRLPLVVEGDQFARRHLQRGTQDAVADAPAVADGSPARLYLGVDIGSISTNLAVIDPAGTLLAKRYLRTASRPIEAVRQGLAEIEAELTERLGAQGSAWSIAGVGTTGSGRYMIADFMGADVVKNEITAQATAAAFIDPRVDTIFEIGGQDSKYISLKDGVIVDFEMNKACAAGTGSFLEEQAEKLDVSVKGEFSDLALAADAPCRLGERCTVFMENSLMSQLTGGSAKEDLLAGLAYSIVENYIGRVVGQRPIGRHIFFQGGTAFNKAVVAAFEKHVGREVTVPPHHDVTGAIGMALIARDHMLAQGDVASAFGGFDLARAGYSLKSFPCRGCDNLCEINQVSIEGRTDKLYYGGRCEKWDIRRGAGKRVEDLFAFRHQALTRAHEARKEQFEAGARQAPRGPLGLPFVFFMHDYLPFYATLLWELGFEVRVSPATTQAVVALGTEAVLADTCFPVKAAQGHVRWLAGQGLETLFIPSFIDLKTPQEPFGSSLACPLTQSFPYQVRAALPGLRLLVPELTLRYGMDEVEKALLTALRPLGVRPAELRRALDVAQREQDAFAGAIRAKGREVLENLEGRALVVMGRPYNAFDMGMNLEIPRKLASLGELAIPMDFLPSEADAGLPPVHKDWPHLYWRSGQRILRAARAIKADPRLFPLYIGNFSCGPDSFILKYYDDEMAGHPAVHIEIDEHSADAGVVTRLEAFLDSLTALARQGQVKPLPPRHAAQPTRRALASRQVTVWVPRMSDHSFAIAGAFQACGVNAQVLPEPDAESVALARRYVSGKECYPCAVTTGDMLRVCLAPGFDPARNAFFMPSGTGPCRFGQYNIFHKMVLDKAGLAGVTVFAPEQSGALYEELGVVGGDFAKRSWDGIVAIDLLQKCLHETRPLELDPGRSDVLYAKYLRGVTETLAAAKPLLPLLERARAEFEAVPRSAEVRPLVGIVGEIFVRTNPFSNEQLVRAVEALGGRAWLAPCDEWIYYVGEISRRKAWKERNVKRILTLGIKNIIQTRAAHKLEHVFSGFLETAPEISIPEVFELARPYISPSFEGEAILSVGKAVDMCQKGCVGIVNAMPFGCMPGSVAGTVLTAVGQRFGVPVVSLAYDGSASPVTSLTLETFMEQARKRVG